MTMTMLKEPDKQLLMNIAFGDVLFRCPVSKDVKMAGKDICTIKKRLSERLRQYYWQEQAFQQEEQKPIQIGITCDAFDKKTYFNFVIQYDFGDNKKDIVKNVDMQIEKIGWIIQGKLSHLILSNPQFIEYNSTK